MCVRHEGWKRGFVFKDDVFSISSLKQDILTESRESVSKKGMPFAL